MVHPIATVIRTDTIESVQRFIRAGYDVNLVSPRGNGNTEFLRALRTELIEVDHEVLVLSDFGERSELPLALANFVSDGDAHVTNETPNALLARLERRLGGSPLIILCDGQSTLRRALRTFIAQCRDRVRVQVVVRTSQPTTTLVPGAQTVTVQLPLLSLEETHSVLAYRLGGVLHRDTIGRIYSKSAGLIKLSILLADVGRLEEKLRLIDQRWIAVGELWSNALHAEVSAYGAELSPVEERAVQLLSFAGVTKLVDAEQLVGGDTLEALEQRALIAIDETGTNHWVTVTPPLLAEKELRQVPFTRRAHLRTHSGVARSDHDGQHTEAARSRVPRLEPAFLRRLSEFHMLRLSEAQHRWALQPNAVNGTELIGAMHPDRDNLESILDIIRTARQMPAETEEAVYLSMWEAWMHGYVRNDTPRALEALAATDEVGLYAGVLAAAQVRMQIDLDAVPSGALSQLDVDDPDLPVLVRNELRRARAYVFLVSGRPHQAVAELERVSSWAQDYFSYQHTSMLSMAVLYTGDAAQAEVIALHGYERALDELDERSLRMHAYVLGHISVVRGTHRNPAVVSETIRALGDYPVVARIGHLGVLVSDALSQTATTPRLSEMIAEIERYAGPEGVLPGTSASLAQAHQAWLAGETVTAAQLAWDVALRLRQRGAQLAAFDAGLTALSYHYEAEHAAELESWVPHIDSELLAVRLEYLTALHLEDLERLTQVIPKLLACGLQHRARQGYTRLTALLETRGHTPLSEVAREQLRALEAQLGVAQQSDGEDAQLDNTLTAREFEVAQLLERGMTNREIQDELVLSIRTVENHVHRILRKLGVTSRSEATTVIRAWMAQHVR